MHQPAGRVQCVAWPSTIALELHEGRLRPEEALAKGFDLEAPTGVSMRRTRAILSVIGALLFAAPAWCESPPESAESADDGIEARVRATLLVDLDLEQARGNVGVLFDLDPGWHMYWRNPGDSGLAPELEFGFSESTVEVGEIAWPAPREFREDVDIVTWGYAEQVLLAAPIALTDGTAEGRVRVEIAVLVCADQCVPATFALERDFVRASASLRDETRVPRGHGVCA